MTAYKYTKEKIEEAVEHSTSFRGVVAYLGGNLSSGGTVTLITKRIKEYGFDIGHFTGKHPNTVISYNKKTAEHYLTQGELGSSRVKTHILRRSMLECGTLYLCDLCGNKGTHNGKPLTLQVDHINGIPTDNRLENLRFLCPNCHSQQETTVGPKTVNKHKQQGSSDKSSATEITIPRYSKNICTCGEEKWAKSVRCLGCEYNRRLGRPSKLPTKISWPPDQELLEMVNTTSFLATGRILGVSDNAVRKRLRVRGLI